MATTTLSSKFQVVIPKELIYSSDAETFGNAFCLGVFSLKQGDTCSAFLLGPPRWAQVLSRAKKVPSTLKIAIERTCYITTAGGDVAHSSQPDVLSHVDSLSGVSLQEHRFMQ